MHIAVVGMLAEPSGASEGSVSWKWAIAYKSLGYSVTLYTSTSQKSFFSQENLNQLDVIFLGNEKASDKAPHTLLQAFRLYGQVQRWHRELERTIADLTKYDLVHQVSLSTIRIPSPLSQLGETLVWGPLGGAHLGYLRGLQRRTLALEVMRNASIRLSYLHARSTGWFERFSGIVLATNRATEQYAQNLGARNVFLELSDGITLDWIRHDKTGKPCQTSPQDSVTAIWAGRLVGSKRPDLAISLIAGLRRDGINARLIICGDGPERSRLLRQISEAGLTASVELVGRKNPYEMRDYIGQAQLCLFTSLRDSSSPFLLEALAQGVACAAIRVQGVEACFPEPLVPGPGYCKKEIDLVEQLRNASVNSIHAEVSDDRIEFAKTHVWEQKAARIVQLQKRLKQKGAES